MWLRLFGSHTVKCPFRGLLSACFSHLFGDFATENGPQTWYRVLFSAPTYKKALLLLTEKINVVDKLHLGMSYSAVDCEFNVN